VNAALTLSSICRSLIVACGLTLMRFLTTQHANRITRIDQMMIDEHIPTQSFYNISHDCRFHSIFNQRCEYADSIFQIQDLLYLSFSNIFSYYGKSTTFLHFLGWSR